MQSVTAPSFVLHCPVVAVEVGGGPAPAPPHLLALEIALNGFIRPVGGIGLGLVCEDAVVLVVANNVEDIAALCVFELGIGHEGEAIDLAVPAAGAGCRTDRPHGEDGAPRPRATRVGE